MLLGTRFCQRLTTCVLAASCAVIGACNTNSTNENSTNGDESALGDVTMAPENLGGEVIADAFLVPAGQTTRVTSDLTIRASGDVEIAGELIADVSSGDGYSITIISEGSVTITGRVVAGDGASGSSTALRTRGAVGTDGSNGGYVIVRSGVNIYKSETAELVAGDGGHGSDGTVGGMGGTGGSITLECQGLMTMLASLTLGHGGNGGNAFTGVSQLPPDGRFTNLGGYGGALAVSASQYDWPGLDTTDPNAYVFDIDAYNRDVTTDFFYGSVGGWAGSVFIVDDVFLPPTQKTRARIIAPSDPPKDCPTGSRCVSAADGGWGFLRGGAGGGIAVTNMMTHADNGNAQSWVVRGGKGGSVDPILDLVAAPPPGAHFVEVIVLGAQGGPGGAAEVRCGLGEFGTAKRPNGANGGNGIAVGGDGGNGLPSARQRGGAGGFASAVGGEGGEGIEDCAPGDGGKGGSAEAYAGNGGQGVGGQGDGVPPANGGEATAVAGLGGYGGDGGPRPGGGGVGGRSFTRDGWDGSTGLPGSVASGAIEKESKADDGEPGSSNIILSCGE